MKIKILLSLQLFFLPGRDKDLSAPLQKFIYKFSVNSRICSFISQSVSLVPQPLPKRVLHEVRSTASFFQFSVSSRFFKERVHSCLRRLPHLLVTSSLYFSLYDVFQKSVPTQDVTNPVSLPSFYCMQDIPLLLDPVQYFIIFHTIGPADLNPSPAPHFKTFDVFLIYFRKSEVSAP